MSAGNGQGDLTNKMVLSENGGVMFELITNSKHKQELNPISFHTAGVFFDYCELSYTANLLHTFFKEPCFD